MWVYEIRNNTLFQSVDKLDKSICNDIFNVQKLFAFEYFQVGLFDNEISPLKQEITIKHTHSHCKECYGDGYVILEDHIGNHYYEAECECQECDGDGEIELDEPIQETIVKPIRLTYKYLVKEVDYHSVVTLCSLNGKPCLFDHDNYRIFINDEV